MKFAKTLALTSSFVLCSLAQAGTVGTYRVAESEILGVSGTVGVYRSQVKVPSKTLEGILKQAKVGDTVVLADSEWKVLDATTDAKALPLEDKTDSENQIEVVSGE